MAAVQVIRDQLLAAGIEPYTFEQRSPAGDRTKATTQQELVIVALTLIGMLPVLALA